MPRGDEDVDRLVGEIGHVDQQEHEAERIQERPQPSREPVVKRIDADVRKGTGWACSLTKPDQTLTNSCRA